MSKVTNNCSKSSSQNLLANVKHSLATKSSSNLSSSSISSNGKSKERHISFNNNLNINELKLNPLQQEPTTPIDKLNTPRTVTVNTTFFPPSPTPIVDNEITITGFY